MIDKSKQQFEDLLVNDNYLDANDIFRIDNCGEYYYLETRRAYKWWQASRESLEIELPTKENTELNDPFEYGLAVGYNNSIDDCKDILISNGVKIKNDR